MGRWELLSKTAALVRPHFFAYTVIVLPALIATYAVDSLAMSYKVDFLALRNHPLQTFLVVSTIRFVQFFLGWLFVAFEFAVILQFLQEQEKGARGIAEAVGRARSSSLQITLLSWAIYWRAVFVFVPIWMFVLLSFTALLKLQERFDPWWLAQIQSLISFALLVLFGSKWLLAFPEVVLRSKRAKTALSETRNESGRLHENMLVLALLFVFVVVFSVGPWPKFLHYVYLPETWPKPVVNALQEWFAPASSLIFDTWAILMLFVGTFVLWESLQGKPREIASHADSLA